MSNFNPNPATVAKAHDTRVAVERIMAGAPRIVHTSISGDTPYVGKRKPLTDVQKARQERKRTAQQARRRTQAA